MIGYIRRAVVRRVAHGNGLRRRGHDVDLVEANAGAHDLAAPAEAIDSICPDSDVEADNRIAVAPKVGRNVRGFLNPMDVQDRFVTKDLAFEVRFAAKLRVRIEY